MYRLIRDCEVSGISQEKFFKERGIAKSTFGYWRKKYQKENRTSKSSFIPVKVSSRNKRAAVPPQGLIELNYPNGVSLTCSDQLDLSRLKTLIVL